MVAPRILWRYILRDTLMHSLLGLAAFTLLLVVMNTLRFMDELLASGVGASGLLSLAGIVLPTYLPYAIPASLLFGVMLSFGRMSADGEIVAMRASGVSVPGLLPPILLLGAAAAVITAWLQFEVAPHASHRMKVLVREMARSVKVIQPHEFRALGPDRIVYVESVGDASCELRGVMIGDFSDQRRPFFVAARCGSIVEGSRKEGLALELLDGSIHFEDDAGERYRRVRFERMRTELDISRYLSRRKKLRDYTFAELLYLDRAFSSGQDPKVRADHGQRSVRTQLHLRAAFSLASVLLSLLAVPLGIQPLRSGRSAGALTAIGLMAIYWVLFRMGENAAESGAIAPAIALWTPNVLVVLVGLWLMRRTVRGES
ncbi:MAG: LptF/LptG family permease [Deltaproteobacteria bacterium]|nr:LptF/LptG family permease [Deltaproteobacteria bacterium]MBW2414468.1 LptF/LptG family permease [Deltaproteobacteria bacterium]